MAEEDERPSKIRKLDPIPDADSQEDVVTISGAELQKEEDINEDAARTGSLGVIDSASVDQGQTFNAAGVSQSQPISKNQLKKLKRKQAWEDARDFRRAKRREHNKEKKARKAELRLATADESPSTGDTAPNPPTKHARAVQVPITFVIDCNFDALMTDKEIVSLSTQITRSYSDNKGAPFRAHFVVSSFQGQLRERFENVLSRNHLGWKAVKFTENDFVEAAQEAHSVMQNDGGGKLLGAFAIKPEETLQTDEAAPAEVSTVTEAAESWPEQSKPVVEETNVIQSDDVDEAVDAESESTKFKKRRRETEPSIVYLTSDSPNTLDRLEPYTTYVIGGIVDKNRHKGICYKRARERNVRTAKLPIGDYLKMQSRAVLATNHVVEIMVRWLEDGDWGRAFLRVIPKRKEAKLKANAKTTIDGEDEPGRDEGEHDELSNISD